MALLGRVVSNGSKILIWKQITTGRWGYYMVSSCFQWFKDTNLKANHNQGNPGSAEGRVVSNGSKILIWKQITTYVSRICCYVSCFQWFKDTNLKANHNFSRGVATAFMVVSNGSKILIWKQITTVLVISNFARLLFPMVQRY